MAGPTLTVHIDGQHVPLDECGWLQREPCGCITAAMVAVVSGQGGWTIADPDTAHRHFTKRKDQRARDIKRGVTVELITMQHYRENIAANWECPAHPRPVPAAAPSR
jgi:hypothetical protein